MDIYIVLIYSPLNMSNKLTNKIILDIFGPTENAGPLKLAPKTIQAKLVSQGISHEARTLRRRLAELVARGDLESEGAGPATRYFLRPPSTNKLELSPQGDALLQKVSVPVSQRTASRFEQEFVADYQPNETFLLPDTLRARLLDRGRSANVQMAAGTYVRDILDTLVVDLAWASSALEGNTYTLGDTKELIERGHAAEGANQAEATMILNHREALQYLVKNAETIAFDHRTLFALHSLLADGLLESSADAGRVRRRAVSIGESRYVPLSSEERINPVLDEIVAKGQSIADPYEQAFFAMAMVPYLQPFVDVNKRTSRLAANIPFIKKNLCPLSFLGTPKDTYLKGIIALYEYRDVALLRDVFAHAYFVSCDRYPVVAASLDKPDPIRLRYREAIKATVSAIVSRTTPPDRIEPVARELMVDIPAEDREAVYHIVLEELASLHEGNIARSRLSWHDFSKWEKLWPDSDTRAARLRALK